MKPLLGLLLLLGLAACSHHRLSDASGTAGEAAFGRDPLVEQKSRDDAAIERRAADYERQGRAPKEARALAEVEYARTPR